jgi:hypothetical protein
MQFDYVFLPPEIPAPVSTPIVDDHHEVIGLASAELSDWQALINNSRIGLARAEVSINEENDDVIGLVQAGAWINNDFPLANFWVFSFALLPSSPRYTFPVSPFVDCKEMGRVKRLLEFFFRNQLGGFIYLHHRDDLLLQG